MMSGITRMALRNLILADHWDVTSEHQREALDELIRLEREDAAKETTPFVSGEQMRDFREYRKTHDRIPTIKIIRSVLSVGLAEALIIVKGIEAHDGIV